LSSSSLSHEVNDAELELEDDADEDEDVRTTSAVSTISRGGGMGRSDNSQRSVSRRVSASARYACPPVFSAGSLLCTAESGAPRCAVRACVRSFMRACGTQRGRAGPRGRTCAGYSQSQGPA